MFCYSMFFFLPENGFVCMMYSKQYSSSNCIVVPLFTMDGFCAFTQYNLALGPRYPACFAAIASALGVNKTLQYQRC